MPDILRKPGNYIRETGATNKTIAGVSTSTTVLIGTFPKGRLYTTSKIRSLQELERTYGGLRTNNFSSLVIKQFFDNGGKNVWVISIGTRLSRTAAPFLKGLSLLSRTPSFNILVMPETTVLPDRETAKVFQSAVALIEKHRAIYLLDPPQQDAIRQTVKALASWFRAQVGIRHPNVVLYFPRVQVRSRVVSLSTVTIPVSGTMAGLFARLDGTRGVWKSPAGTEATLRGVVGLDQLLTSRDIDLLTSANINALKQIPSSLYVAWGARTLSSDPEWKYVPVRRTALFLESSIQQGTTWAVFEPNDEPLWAQIRQSVEIFLEGLFRKGAFQGPRAKDAYFVKCGRETTTITDQSAGIIHILVGFAPLRPAEFVVLKIQQKASPVSFGKRP